MKKFLIIFSAALFSLPIAAQEGVSGQTSAPSFTWFSKEIPLKANKEFQFLAYYINQAVTSNMYPKNDLLKGQVVGRLFGSNTSRTSNQLTSAYLEQRLIPFIIYQPHLFNGKAILRMSFEIDWTWGDVSYGTGGNFGSAFSADQVNLQTQNIEIELNPVPRLYINLGLQRLFDTPYNPYRTMVDKMLTTGYRLMYFGSDGVGVNARYDWDFARLRAGYYKLYENYIQKNDDVSLFELIGEKDISRAWKAGGSVYYMPDRASGQGGISVFGQGLNSSWARQMGTYQFRYGAAKYKADIAWLGAFFGRNTEHWLDEWQLNGFVNVNIGRSDTATVENPSTKDWKKATDIFGFAANLRGSYRYGQTLNDCVSLDLLYASGDANGLKDGKFNGVITGNYYGGPGAIPVGTGSYLVLPHSNVVNRYTPAVADISNMGYGMAFAAVNVSKSFIPNRLNGKIGGVFAASPITPVGGGNIIGSEINGNLCYNFGPYMSVELHAAKMFLGNFYDSNQNTYSSAVNGWEADHTTPEGVEVNEDGLPNARPTSPWTAFLVFKWLLF
ncbi:MAG: hypothetical protein LBS01_10515 [Prevotellaceae bacterium]|jgi:hypothetical protein|nr:hypothetical protein [Prevotellaceae bacterium]